MIEVKHDIEQRIEAINKANEDSVDFSTKYRPRLSIVDIIPILL